MDERIERFWTAEDLDTLPEDPADIRALMQELVTEMRAAAKELEFERAAALRDQVKGGSFGCRSNVFRMVPHWRRWSNDNK